MAVRRAAGPLTLKCDLLEKSDDNAPDDACDQAREERRPRRQGYPQAEREGDEKDHQPGGEVAPRVGKKKSLLLLLLSSLFPPEAAQAGRGKQKQLTAEDAHAPT